MGARISRIMIGAYALAVAGIGGVISGGVIDRVGAVIRNSHQIAHVSTSHKVKILVLLCLLLLLGAGIALWAIRLLHLAWRAYFGDSLQAEIAKATPGFIRRHLFHELERPQKT